MVFVVKEREVYHSLSAEEWRSPKEILEKVRQYKKLHPDTDINWIDITCALFQRNGGLNKNLEILLAREVIEGRPRDSNDRVIEYEYKLTEKGVRISGLYRDFIKYYNDTIVYRRQ